MNSRIPDVLQGFMLQHRLKYKTASALLTLFETGHVINFFLPGFPALLMGDNDIYHGGVVNINYIKYKKYLI